MPDAGNQKIMFARFLAAHGQDWTGRLRHNLVRNRAGKMRGRREISFGTANPENDQIDMIPFRDAQNTVRGSPSSQGASWFRYKTGPKGNHIAKSLERRSFLSIFGVLNRMQQDEFRAVLLCQGNCVTSCRERIGIEVGRVQDAI